MDKAVDLGLGLGPRTLSDNLPVLIYYQRGNRGYAVPFHKPPFIVNIDPANNKPALVRRLKLVKNLSHHPAGAAPGRPKI
jgi:hypothetical protein